MKDSTLFFIFTLVSFVGAIYFRGDIGLSLFINAVIFYVGAIICKKIEGK